MPRPVATTAEPTTSRPSTPSPFTTPSSLLLPGLMTVSSFLIFPEKQEFPGNVCDLDASVLLVTNHRRHGEYKAIRVR